MYETHKLSNGIQVIMKELPVYRSASIGIWVKTGSINETNQNSGISHFIEHMIFKGTKNHSAKSIAEFFDGIGGDLNAFTSKECTCFHAKVLDEHLEQAILIMGDMLSHPMMDSEDIRKEKGVVLDEIYMAEDTPDDVSYDLIAKTVYGDGPLGKAILGTKESVQSFNQAMISDYLKTYYTTENVVVSIAGSYNAETTLKALEAALKLPCRVDSPERTCNTFSASTAYIYRDIEQVHLEIAFEGVPYCSNKMFDLAALNAIVGSSVSSRLFQNIRENHGLTYTINSYVSQYEAEGLFNIYASMNKENLLQVVALIQKELDDIKKNGVDEVELARVKEQLKGNYILDLEGSESYMTLLGKGKLFSKPIYSTDEIENRINGITLDSVNHMAKFLFNKLPAFTLVGRVDEKDVQACRTYLMEEK